MVTKLLSSAFLLCLVVPLLGVLEATTTESASAAPAGSVRVAVANVREGAVLRPRADLRDGRDRRTFARRLFAQRGRVPDVVLLQEARGSARKIAHALGQTRRAERTGAAFRVVRTPGLRTDSGRCDGPRAGRYPTLRDSAVLVNTRTVRKVRARGHVRTWGRWSDLAGRRMGSAYGCAEHPWVRVTVRRPGGTAVTARVASVHVAPSGNALKNRAVDTIRRRFDAMHRRTPRDRVVLGGDLNLSRCTQDPRRGETRHCAVRPGHRSLLAAGYVDAVRSRHLTGPSGVLGVGRRIDFVYAKGQVTASWFDRCYQAYLVRHRPCARHRAVFGAEKRFHRCQRQFLYGAGAGGCSTYHRSRYYSDHPILLATVR